MHTPTSTTIPLALIGFIFALSVFILLNSLLRHIRTYYRDRHRRRSHLLSPYQDIHHYGQSAQLAPSHSLDSLGPSSPMLSPTTTPTPITGQLPGHSGHLGHPGQSQPSGQYPGQQGQMSWMYQIMQQMLGSTPFTHTIPTFFPGASAGVSASMPNAHAHTHPSTSNLANPTADPEADSHAIPLTDLPPPPTTTSIHRPHRRRRGNSVPVPNTGGARVGIRDLILGPPDTALDADDNEHENDRRRNTIDGWPSMDGAADRYDGDEEEGIGETEDEVRYTALSRCERGGV